MTGKITSYFRETKDELVRVSWPGRQVVLKHTLLVVGISLGVAIYLGGADFLFTYLLAKIIIR
jgi:preprotein translocase subunit SecE